MSKTDELLETLGVCCRYCLIRQSCDWTNRDLRRATGLSERHIRELRRRLRNGSLTCEMRETCALYHEGELPQTVSAALEVLDQSNNTD